jgi:hypothetical protein
MTKELTYEDGWQLIETAPMTQDDILVSGWYFPENDDHNSGYLNQWDNAPLEEIRKRYQCIASMLDTSWGRRCVGHRNGPRNVTHWRPLPADPVD